MDHGDDCVSKKKYSDAIKRAALFKTIAVGAKTTVIGERYWA